MSAWWVTGHTLDVLRAMPDDSVDLVLTSPPFLALRSYLPADDPAKSYEIGSEATPGEFLDVLLDVTEELRRVLTPHGSLCVELGDTYSGSGGAGGDYGENGRREGLQQFKRSASKSETGEGWPMDKSQCLIPESYRFALAYGRNPHTGRETPRWRVRNTVRWVRPNPPVGALGDKFRPATSEMVVATVAKDRYFDLDAVRGPGSPNTHARTAKGVERRESTGKTADDGRRGGNFSTLDTIHDTNGAPPLDWWKIPTAPYKGSHYATYPPELCEKPIKAMCPTRVCTVCGEPSRRIVERPETEDDGRTRDPERLADYGGERHGNRTRTATTSGWTDCGHDAWRPGRVLDPFGGSGTTLAVATGHGRDAIGIDLDARNAALARERVGMWLTEVTPTELAMLLDATGRRAA